MVKDKFKCREMKEQILGIKKCDIHKENNYNCEKCCNYIMAGMEEVNRKYEPNLSNPEYPDEY